MGASQRICLKIEACKKMCSRIVLQKLKYTLRAKNILRVVLENRITLSYKPLCLDWLISKNLFQNWSVPQNVLENCTSKLKYSFKQTIRFRWVDLKESVSNLKRDSYTTRLPTWKITVTFTHLKHNLEKHLHT